MKKILIVGIILLFLGSSIPALAQNKEHIRPLSHTLYVGGTGPGNYTKIQDAINASSSGDTIFVFGGTYKETLSINVSNLTINGEDYRTTSIWNDNEKSVINIFQNSVTISGFSTSAFGSPRSSIKVKNGLKCIDIKNNNLASSYFGILFDGNNENITIENNKFSDDGYGIYIVQKLNGGVIVNNYFYDDVDDIILYGLHCELKNNTFAGCHGWCIQLVGNGSLISDNLVQGDEGVLIDGHNNMITNNSFKSAPQGLTVGGNNNIITNSSFDDMSDYGILILHCCNNSISNCSFINCGTAVYFEYGATGCILKRCSFRRNSCAVHLTEWSNGEITLCDFYFNKQGINLDFSVANITRNNLRDDRIVFLLNYDQIRKVTLSQNFYGFIHIPSIRLFFGIVRTRFHFVPPMSYETIYTYRPGILKDFNPEHTPIKW